jgi:hypothetical protein
MQQQHDEAQNLLGMTCHEMLVAFPKMLYRDLLQTNQDACPKTLMTMMVSKDAQQQEPSLLEP